MLAGGLSTLFLQLDVVALPRAVAVPGLDATAYGIALSAIVFATVSLLWPDRAEARSAGRSREST
jgi:hypothetical protein